MRTAATAIERASSSSNVRPRAAFRQPVGHALHLAVRTHEDQELLGLFGHVALEFRVPDDPPRHREVTAEQLVVGRLPPRSR